MPIDLHSDALHSCHLAQVVSVQDPDNLARVKVKLLTIDGEGSAELWARVAVAFAGASRGALFIPDVDDEVLVTFLAGDPRFPIVIGSLWNGGQTPPETFSGNRVDRWTLTGKAGTRIAIVEESAGSAKIEFTTPNGVSGVLTDEGGGSITLEDISGNSVKLEPAGITVQASAKVTVNASQVAVSAGMVTVDAGMSRFSGVVQCDTLIATTVVGTTYTPGAGNIW
ncbi:MAG: hypothetical protein H7067_02550 [Burkholderiales bacterium]|nr:hypothetical protein [Opitutaceae bacterium]